MDPIPVKDEDAELLREIQKSLQRARLAFDREEVRELEERLREKIYELYPETAGHNVRFDVTAQKIFVWEIPTRNRA